MYPAVCSTPSLQGCTIRLYRDPKAHRAEVLRPMR